MHLAFLLPIVKRKSATLKHWPKNFDFEQVHTFVCATTSCHQRRGHEKAPAVAAFGIFDGAPPAERVHHWRCQSLAPLMVSGGKTQSDKSARMPCQLGLCSLAPTLIVAFDKVIPAIKDGAAPDVEPLSESCGSIAFRSPIYIQSISNV
jgi:hypothetical protein